MTVAAPQAIPVLLVEDSAADALLVQEHLRESNGQYVVAHVTRLHDALAALEDSPARIVLLDLGLPDSAGPSGVREITTRFPDVAVVVLTGNTNTTAALEALEAGAQDYLSKDEASPELLERVVRYAIARTASSRAVATAEGRWKAFATNAPDIVLILDSEFRVTWINRNPMTAGTEVIGQSALEFLGGGEHDRVVTTLQRVLETGKPELFEVQGVVAGGRDGWYSVSAARDAALSDGRWGLVLFARDVSAQRAISEALRERDAQLQQAERLEVVGRLAGGIAHDFNNLLTGILGFGQFVRKTFEEGDPRIRDMDLILDTAGRAAKLTRQLLTFSRRQPLERSVFDLADVVRDLEMMSSRLIGEDIVLELQLGPEPAKLHADRGQVEQVLMNLIVNARDAMPHGGRIRIITGLDELGQETADDGSVLPGGPHARLSVQDNGQGMNAETQAQIFEPFFTTKGEGHGTGLGLATVYGVVRQNAGRIAIESAPGTGTTFHIHLPVAAVPPDTGVRRRPSEAATPGEGVRVLVVEDDAVLREVVGRILEAEGHEVVTAAAADEAIALAEGPLDPCQLLVTDVVMPGMNGVECARRLRGLWPDLQVIYMTGYADPGTMAQIDEDLDALLLDKPFTAAQLANTVRGTLDEQAGVEQ